MSSGVSINIFISPIYKLDPNRSYLPLFSLASSHIWHLHNELGIIDFHITHLKRQCIAAQVLINPLILQYGKSDLHSSAAAGVILSLDIRRKYKGIRIVFNISNEPAVYYFTVHRAGSSLSGKHSAVFFG